MINTIKSINKVNKYLIESFWSDGFSSTIKISVLRNNCPCAICEQKKEEAANNPMPQLNTIRFGEYELKDIEMVGNYAIKIIWGDVHDFGIYDWQLFRKLFEDNQLPDEEKNRLIEAENKNMIKKTSKKK